MVLAAGRWGLGAQFPAPLRGDPGGPSRHRVALTITLGVCLNYASL